MSQVLIYKGIQVQAQDMENGKVLVQTRNPVDAQKAGIPFKELQSGVAIFEAWVPQAEIVPIN
ncbi:MAG: hypothetical protein H6510_11050 [Acidobacteria bacterium]|nr:hypothetical protein [Acidobacteriota bacterium]MCB9398343.1 hypothetical protein [Acidobacteriota bacterium]